MKNLINIIKNQQVFVTLEQEEEYCRKNKIHIKRLENGITIIGITREVSDLVKAGIEFIFPTGSYFDPRGKTGIHHLTEHLYHKAFHKKAKESGILLDAATNYYEVVNMCNGTVNPVVKNYGLWPFLPKITQELFLPTKFLKNSQKIINAEKEVVKREMIRKKANHERQVYRFLKQVIYHSENPLTIENLGTEEDLATINLADVNILTRERFIPEGMITTILCEANDEVTKLLTHKLEDLLNKEKGDKKRAVLDWSLLDKLNPEFCAGKIYYKDLGLKNRTVTLIFAWSCDLEPFDPRTMALDLYSSLVSEKLHLYSRKKGWSYVSFVRWNNAGISKGDFCLGIDILKKDSKEIDNFAKHVWLESQQKILNLNHNEMKAILIKEERRQRANPITATSRLDNMSKGLRKWGRPVNTDEIRKLLSQIKIDDLQYWQNKFINTPPAIIIAGDLS